MMRKPNLIQLLVKLKITIFDFHQVTGLLKQSRHVKVFAPQFEFCAHKASLFFFFLSIFDTFLLLLLLRM